MWASARCRPTSRGSRWVLPPPGTCPNRAWLSAILAFSCTSTMSQDCINSKPPAIAYPSTTATTGTGSPGMQAQARPKCSNSGRDRKSTRLNSSHVKISYAVFCLKKKKHRAKKGQYQNGTNEHEKRDQRQEPATGV